MSYTLITQNVSSSLMKGFLNIIKYKVINIFLTMWCRKKNFELITSIKSYDKITHSVTPKINVKGLKIIPTCGQRYKQLVHKKEEVLSTNT